MQPQDIALSIRRPFHIATTGRPGPVLVDIPDVVQQQARVRLPGRRCDLPRLPADDRWRPGADQARRRAHRAGRRPIIIAGHGVVSRARWDELVAVRREGADPGDHDAAWPRRLPGSARPQLRLARHARHVLRTTWRSARPTSLIGIGMRFDDRVTGRLKDFDPDAKIVHIDIDPAEIGKNIAPRCRSSAM